MKKDRLLELAGLTEAKKAFAVIVKHKGESAVAITPHGGVTKDRAMEVKNLLMDLKKDGMKGGKPSDYAEITVKPVGTLKEEAMQVNEENNSQLAMKLSTADLVEIVAYHMWQEMFQDGDVDEFMDDVKREMQTHRDKVK